MLSNLEMLRNLDNEYIPETKGIVNIHEIYLINKVLCLDEMDKIQLFNLRDMATMWYASKIDDNDESLKNRMVYMDKLSAITNVIDLKLWNLEKEDE